MHPPRIQNWALRLDHLLTPPAAQLQNRGNGERFGYETYVNHLGFPAHHAHLMGAARPLLWLAASIMTLCSAAELGSRSPTAGGGGSGGGWVSFWYYPPAYGGEDINATLAMLNKHPGVTTSVMLGCDHAATADGSVSTPKQTSLDLCTQTIAGLVAAKVKPELVLGGSNITQLRSFFANADANIDALVKIGKQVNSLCVLVVHSRLSA